MPLTSGVPSAEKPRFQARVEGLEPTTAGSVDRCPVRQHRDLRSGLLSGLPRDLAEVVEAWPDLDETIQTAIVTMARQLRRRTDPAGGEPS